MNSQSTARPAAAGKGLKPYGKPSLAKGPVLSRITAGEAPSITDNVG